MASSLLQLKFAVALAAALLLAALATPLAGWLQSPQLAPYLRALALSIPITGLAGVHRCALVAQGAFGRSTLPGLLYWPARLLLALLLLQQGLGVWAGIWALIGASLIELLTVRLLVRFPLLYRGTFPLDRFLTYSLPLFLNSMGIRLLTRVDLLLVQSLAGSAAAGFYGAAHNLSLIPLGFLGQALSSPLLSTLSRLNRSTEHQHQEQSRNIIQVALRFLICLLPMAALVAGAAPQLVTLLYGAAFLHTAPMLAWLIFAALALTMVGVCGALLTAGGKPGWTVALTAPLLPAAALAHWLLIPRYGAVSAAAVTCAAAVLGAVACLVVAARVWRVRLPLGTVFRSTALAALAYTLASRWPLSGAALLLKLVLLAGAIVLAFIVLGEFSSPGGGTPFAPGGEDPTGEYLAQELRQSREQARAKSPFTHQPYDPPRRGTEYLSANATAAVRERQHWIWQDFAPWLRQWWGARRTPALRWACLAMALLALTKLGSEFYRLIWEPGVKGAIDLKLLREFTISWFSRIPVYEHSAFADYPPATAPLLWPLLSWPDLGSARVLWAVTSILALIWLVWLLVRSSGADPQEGVRSTYKPLEVVFVALMCLSLNALGVVIGNGQLILHILPPLLTAILWLARPRRGWRMDLLIAALMTWSLVKPSVSAPFVWIVLFLPGGRRPALLTAAAYAALTLLAAAFQQAPLPTLLAGFLAQAVAVVHTGYGNIQTWLVALGLQGWTLPAMAGSFVVCGAWVYHHRSDDPWSLLGVVAIVARLWTYHHKYDDLLILLPMVTLFRMAKRGPLPRDRDVWAGLLLAITIVAMLLPARLRFAPIPWSWLFTLGHPIVWIVILLFLLRPEVRTT